MHKMHLETQHYILHAISNATHIATDLLKSGADPTISSTTTKQTPLMLALSRHYYEMVILLTKYYSVKFRNVDNKEARLKALYIASARNAIESTTNLLKAGTDPNKDY